MTDSSNFRDIDPVCEADQTSAACFSGNTLWVGDKTGKTWIADKTDGSTSSLFKTRGLLNPPFKNYVVKTFIPINEPRAMIIHYCTLGGRAGPVEIVHIGGLRILFPQNALIVSSSFSTISPKVALVLDNTISIYSFVGSALVFDNKITSKSIISACSCCNDFLIFFDSGIYQKYDFKTKEVTHLPESPVQIPQTHTLSSNSILCSYRESMVVYSSKSKDNVTIPYNSKYGAPNRYYGSGRSLYMFYKQLFTRVDIKAKSEPQVFDFDEVKTSVMVGTELLVINADKWRVYGSVRPLSELKDELIKGNKEKVYTTLKSLPEDQCSSCVIGIFAQLWPENKILALELTTNFLWLGEIRQLFALFPQIKLDVPQEKRTLISKGDVVTITKDNLRNDIFSLLQKTAEFMFERLYKKNPESKDIKCIADTLLQIYTINNETRKFNDFFTKYSNLINNDRYEEFFQPLLDQKFPITPCVAVYYTHNEKTNTAMEMWKELYSKTPNDLYLSEASYTIREIVESDDFLNNLEWLKSKKPEFVAAALLSTKHEQKVVLDFLNINDSALPGARMEYYNFIVQQPDILPESTIVNSVFDSFTNILHKISTNSFNKEDVIFTESYKKGLDGSELIAEVKKELNAKIISLLSQHINLIDYREALKKVDGEAFDKQIKLCIYKVTKNYKEGISVILKANAGKDTPFDEIQEFCRTSPNPPNAFNAVFSLVPVDEMFTSSSTFIKENILYMDPMETIKQIPRDIDIKRVSDIIRILFNLLTQRNEELDKQVAIIKSLQDDIDFELAYEQSKFVTIENNTTCTVCNKPIYARNIFCILPDGKLCHPNCKPKQFK
jgi:hypothetical protein